jgi:hypothetical protein
MEGEGMFLLPPAADKCQDCGRKHAAEQPHDALTLFYQVKFKMENDRAPTWVDAMAHCSDAVREHWTAALRQHGVDVASGQLRPARAAGK